MEDSNEVKYVSLPIEIPDECERTFAFKRGGEDVTLHVAKRSFRPGVGLRCWEFGVDAPGAKWSATADSVERCHVRNSDVFAIGTTAEGAVVLNMSNGKAAKLGVLQDVDLKALKRAVGL